VPFIPKKNFAFDIKIPIDEIGENNLKITWHQQSSSSKLSCVGVNESTDLSALSKLAKEAYIRANK
jgi:hypothetical protein